MTSEVVTSVPFVFGSVKTCEMKLVSSPPTKSAYKPDLEETRNVARRALFAAEAVGFAETATLLSVT